MKIGDLFNVEGLATVVTGAASGIGYACAEAMADNGARVTLMDIDTAGLDKAVETLAERGGKVRGQAVDVTDRAGLKAAFEEAHGHYGRLDVVFANAGIGGGPGYLGLDGTRAGENSIAGIGDERWDGLISTDLTSVFMTVRAAARHMKRDGRGGRIVVTTSIAAHKNERFVGIPYMAAKAGAAQLVRQAGLELARYGIHVNAMAPGPFVTNVSGGRFRDPALQAEFAKLTPMKRIATPDEIQGLALLLASPASSYMTGGQYVIDGGALLGGADPSSE